MQHPVLLEMRDCIQKRLIYRMVLLREREREREKDTTAENFVLLRNLQQRRNRYRLGIRNGYTIVCTNNTKLQEINNNSSNNF